MVQQKPTKVKVIGYTDPGLPAYVIFWMVAFGVTLMGALLFVTLGYLQKARRERREELARIERLKEVIPGVPAKGFRGMNN